MSSLFCFVFISSSPEKATGRPIHRSRRCIRHSQQHIQGHIWQARFRDSLSARLWSQGKSRDWFKLLHLTLLCPFRLSHKNVRINCDMIFTTRLFSVVNIRAEGIFKLKITQLPMKCFMFCHVIGAWGEGVQASYSTTLLYCYLLQSEESTDTIPLSAFQQKQRPRPPVKITAPSSIMSPPRFLPTNLNPAAGLTLVSTQLLLYINFSRYKKHIYLVLWVVCAGYPLL